MLKQLLSLAFFAVVTLQLSAQTIVSTEPQNKKVVLEEFTGIYCVFCPDGHAIANAIQTANPDDVVLINVHVGGFAAPTGNDPDFRTDFGTALANQSGLTGYPAGTVNRTVFPGMQQGAAGTTAMGRGNWTNASNQTLTQASPVNVAATATLDVATSTLTVYVEVYYTANSDVATNRLNVALMQGNIVGPQTGGNQGNNYNHQHALRHLLTGQWGEVIDTTTAGYFEAFTYEYVVPSAYRNVPVAPADLELAVFVAEGQQKIITGINVTPTFIVENAIDAHAIGSATLALACGAAEVTPTLRIRNDGNDTLTSLSIQYAVNGGESNAYEWTGSLSTLQSATVTLPAVAYVPVETGSNEVIFSVSNPNGSADENAENNTQSTTFENLAHFPTQTVNFTLRTDNYGYETYWELRQSGGAVLASGGNLNVRNNGGGQQTAAAGNPGAYGNNQTITQAITLPADGCYEFRILDDYSDGICCAFGNGYYRLADVDGNILISGGTFGKENLAPFSGEVVVSAADVIEAGQVSVFPNPVTSSQVNVRFNLVETATVGMYVSNALGQRVVSAGQFTLPSGRQEQAIDVANLANGIYFLTVQTSEGNVTQKFTLAR